MLDLDQKSNSLDQYNRRSRLEIQRIPANFADEKLEEKVTDIFSWLGIAVEGADIGDCHRLGFPNLKNVIFRFVNQKYFYQTLDKKLELNKLDSERLGFNPIKALYIKENFTQSVTGLEM